MNERRDKGNERRSVLLVEDDAAMRVRLAEAVQRDPRLALEAAVGSCAEAREALDRSEPDVLLVDLGLPDGDGIDIVRGVRARGYATEMMVITVFGDERHLISAIEAGATGYLLKDEPLEQVPALILRLLEGGSPISASIARHLLRRFRDPPETPPVVGVDVPRLTEREQDVLLYLVKGFTFVEIANLLAISAHTVTSHVKHIYRKLEVRSRAEAVYEALQLGLVKRDC